MIQIQKFGEKMAHPKNTNLVSICTKLPSATKPEVGEMHTG